MSEAQAKQRIYDVVAASDKPMSCAEIIAATGLGSTGVYITVYKLVNEGRLRKRARAVATRGRPLSEYFVRPPTEAAVNLDDYQNEIPEAVWWQHQERLGFRRPNRAAKESRRDRC